ncbi:hypothetical protein PR202_ga20787 [Eleusine coracana subsp. coracana]|uniref:Pentatricopeptide repeat-containing protein n=1 Tax=Eleusine coracana subsp. coracana TaxID=191504 RepID=A0AAV5CZ71_ELECO|nr:hypothetical protein PR202_ga20787 [Eleusine coracana subsp. coracana]
MRPRSQHHLALAAAKSHAVLLKSGISSPTPWNQLLTAYSTAFPPDPGLGLAAARRVFDEIPRPDAVSWNSLLAAHVAAGAHRDAWRLLGSMHARGLAANTFALGSALRSAAATRRPALGAQLQSFAIKSRLADNVFTASALLDVYAKCGRLSDARRLFDRMPERNTVSWNAIIAGFVESRKLAPAMDLFLGMEREGLVPDEATFATLLAAVEGPSRCMQSENMRTDEYTFSAVLRSCSDLGILQLDDARKSFEEADKSSSVPWNSMIFGYAQHGQAHTVTNLFNEMLELEVPLDHVTFVGLITAYSHAGLVDKGSEILDAMETRYGVPLRMEHYACGVDLYGRAGHLDKAKELIESMPFEPDAMVWMTLLGSCRIHGNMELASDVASHLFVTEPKQHSTYVLLSSMYSGLGMWSDRAVVQRVMKDRGLSKVPGWSWIELKNEVHSFNAEDRLHPRTDQIYEMLTMLLRVAQKLSSFDNEEILMTISGHT